MAAIADIAVSNGSPNGPVDRRTLGLGEIIAAASYGPQGTIQRAAHRAATSGEPTTARPDPPPMRRQAGQVAGQATDNDGAVARINKSDADNDPVVEKRRRIVSDSRAVLPCSTRRAAPPLRRS